MNRDILGLIKKIESNLINLKESNIEQNQESMKLGVFTRDFGMKHFDWPQGVGLYAIYRLYLLTNDEAYFTYLNSWFLNQINNLPSKNINTTIPVLTLLLINQKLNNPKYTKIITEYKNYLLHELPRTEEGGFEHVTTSSDSKDDIKRHPNELWIDTIFMSVLFLANYAKIYNDEECLNEVIKQLDLHIKYLFNDKTGLFYHGYSFNRKDNFAYCYWARGNSWFTLGLPLIISVLKDRIKIDKYVIVLIKQVEALAKLNDKGLYHTILDDDSSYLESSGSAGITAGIILSINSGLINNEYNELIEESINSLINKVNDDGELNDVSCGTGIYTKLDDYKNVIRKPMPYGQSLMMLALIEYYSYQKEK